MIDWEKQIHDKDLEEGPVLEKSLNHKDTEDRAQKSPGYKACLLQPS